MKTFGALLAAMALLLCGAASADGRTTVFKGDFATVPDMSGWRTLWKKPPLAARFPLVAENGERFLRTSGVFGICAPLRPAIVVDASVASVELAVTLRQPEGNGAQLRFALSSRDYPEPGSGRAFLKAKDSGMLVTGYQHSWHGANYIAWRKEGRETQTHPYKEPFNLLLKTGAWTQWRLVYDNQGKQLRFFRGGEAEPLITQHNVDLEGVGLDSVWLGAGGAEYLNVDVSYMSKKEQGK